MMSGLSIGADAVDVTQRVQATGMAAIHAGDVGAACEQARRAALREAVEEGVGILVTSTTKINNYAVIDDRILSVTKGYVRSYEVVEQGGDDAGACHVTVDAVVDLGQLHQKLAALDLAAIGAGLPRVLCVAEETLGGEHLGWEVVSNELHAIISGMTDLLDVDVDRGRDHGDSRADIIIRGTAAVMPTHPPIPLAGRLVLDTGLATAGATLGVEVSWVDEDNPVGVLTAIGRGAGPSPRAAGEKALRHAVALLGDSLRALLAEDLRQRAFSTRVVELIIEGPRVMADIDEVVRALESGLGSIQSLTPREAETGRATFQLRSTASAFDLARRLSAHGLETASVEILQVTANRLRVSLGTAEFARDTE
jgi:hypothetical protein